MTKLLTVCVLILLATTAMAEDLVQCVEDLEGLKNPEIVRFGVARTMTPMPPGYFTPIQNMANLMLDHVPSESANQIQIAMPIFLSVNDKQPQQFWDGQQNALATFGPFQTAPFAAILTRMTNSSDSSLALSLSKELPGYKDIGAIEISILGQSQKIPIDQNGLVRFPVNLQGLSWDQMFGAKPVFFRPVGWNDWFAIQFPYPYISIETLMAGTTPKYQFLPDGKSNIDPLGMKGSNDIQSDLRNIKDSDNEGFLLGRAEQVHGVYWLTSDERGPKILTSNGGVWTRFREDKSIGFKDVYLAKDARDPKIEMRDGVVSGTGPHYIGANGEIILNSLGQNNLMTFYGIPSPKTGPDGHPLAWNFSNQWVGTWLKPGQAFVTPRGLYHWHLNHSQGQIAAQVLTPPEIPSENNHFGFPRK